MHDPDETVRWRAVEAALAAGKEKAVVPVLEALNPAGKYKQEDLDSYVVHDLVLVGPAALAPLQTEMASKNAVARKVARVRPWRSCKSAADDRPRRVSGTRFKDGGENPRFRPG